MNNWVKEFCGAVTLCDENAQIIYLNDKSVSTFDKYGGENLIGQNLLDCHNQDSQNQIKEIMNSKKPNVYTIEKNGIKKMIYQTPWFENGEYKGLLELSLEIPYEMPHFKRD